MNGGPRLGGRLTDPFSGTEAAECSLRPCRRRPAISFALPGVVVSGHVGRNVSRVQLGNVDNLFKARAPRATARSANEGLTLQGSARFRSRSTKPRFSFHLRQAGLPGPKASRLRRSGWPGVPSGRGSTKVQSIFADMTVTTELARGTWPSHHRPACTMRASISRICSPKAMVFAARLLRSVASAEAPLGGQVMGI